MPIHLRWLTAPALALMLGAPHTSSAQIEPYNFKFNSGQNIQPIFEGWSRNPDGTFDMHFGYLNRNYAEELLVPVGPDNTIDPAGPDRGQPTYFYNRINRNMFTVTVPKEFGKREITWSLTVRGKTEKAIGWLHPEWEANANNPSGGGGAPKGEAALNKPPTITIDPVQPITLPNTLTLTASVTDDGLPKPPDPKQQAQRKQAVGQETPPTLVPPPGLPEIPVNVPTVAPRGGGPGRGRGAPRPQAPTVTWIVWRGPAAVTFSPAGPTEVKDGKVVATATFTKPGAYVLRARASDSALSTVQDIRVTVN